MCVSGSGPVQEPQLKVLLWESTPALLFHHYILTHSFNHGLCELIPVWKQVIWPISEGPSGLAMNSVFVHVCTCNHCYHSNQSASLVRPLSSLFESDSCPTTNQIHFTINHSYPPANTNHFMSLSQ